MRPGAQRSSPEVHLKGTHVGIQAEVVGQVIFDLTVTEFYQSLAQAELRENSEHSLEDIIDVLQILCSERQRNQMKSAS